VYSRPLDLFSDFRSAILKIQETEPGAGSWGVDIDVGRNSHSLIVDVIHQIIVFPKAKHIESKAK